MILFGRRIATMGKIRFHFGGESWLRLLVVLLAVGLLVLMEPLGRLGLRSPSVQGRQADGYEDELAKGRELLRRHKFEEALKSFKRANEMRGKKSAECFIEMAQAYHGLEAYKNAAESCDRVLELAPNDPKLRAQAFNLKGIALQTMAGSKDQKHLQEAEAAFRQGLMLNAGVVILQYNLGMALLQQGRDAEGIAELQKYLQVAPGAPNVDQARQLIENPRRAREAYAPDFSITTADGEFLSLEDLRGKVVLLDFWGTWCPPCVESVGSMRELHKKYAKDPSFVMIAISVNDEEDTWRAFTTKNQMVWPQYLDREHKIQRAFGIRAFPTYIIIDHEGIVKFRSSGASFMRTANLEDAIRKQVKLVAKAAPGE